jgi:rhodanese-related sulfurtransferase
MSRTHVLALLLVLTGSACASIDFLPASDLHAASTAEDAGPQHTPLTVDEVAAKLDADGGSTFVFDTDGKELYAAAHVPGAIWIGYGDVPSGALPPDKNASLIFYCLNTTCDSAARSAHQAMTLGYPHVYRMPAGLDGWRKAKKNVERGTESETVRPP